MKQTELLPEKKRRPQERNAINSSYHTTTLCINEHCARMTLQLEILNFWDFFHIWSPRERTMWFANRVGASNKTICGINYII